MKLKNQESITSNDIKKLYNPTTKQNISSFTKIFIIVFVLISTIFFFLKFGITEQFNVSGTSMNPTLEDQQIITIDKFLSKITKPKRGDIVVIYDGTNYVVKRDRKSVV